MTHLKVTQSDTSEMIGSSSNQIGAKVIKDLYEKTFNGVDNTSELSGVVSVDKAHRNAVEYLQNHTNLRISVTGGYYIGFQDPLVEQILMQHSVGDGFGITEGDATSYSPSNGFVPGYFSHSDITSFDELSYFTNIISYGYTTQSWSDTIGFQGCTSLVSVDVNNIVPQTDTHGGYYNIGGAFNQCSNLVTVKNFKESIIGPCMFRYCEKLKNIDLSHVTVVFQNAFEGCFQLDVKQQGLDFSKITDCRNTAFKGCPNIGDVEMPLLTGEFGIIFDECSSITSISNLPNITSISYPDNRWHGVFYNCTNLDTIDLSLSTNVTVAQRGIAGVVPNLRILKLPSSITTVKELLIYDCPRLQALVMLAPTPPTFDSDWVWGNNVSRTFKIYVPDNSVSAYQSVLSDYSSRIFSLTQYAIDFTNE